MNESVAHRVASTGSLASSDNRTNRIIIPFEVSAIEEESVYERHGGNSLDLQCWISNSDSGGGWVAPGVMAIGDRLKIWFDPSRCHSSPYPFKIDSVRMAIYYPGAGTISWTFDIECPVIPGDSCSGPGTTLFTSAPFTYTKSGAAGGVIHQRAINAGTGICVSGPIFLGFEIVSWSGSSVPSPYWDMRGRYGTPPGACRQWLCDPACISFDALWPDTVRGNILARLHGNTNDVCTPLNCETPMPCDVVCPNGTPQEGEPDCQDQYVDNYNGGCNSSPPVFGSLTCGQSICGSSGTYIYADTTQHSYRDTDWYRIVVGNQSVLTWTAIAEFPLQLLVMEPVNESCDTYSILASASGDSCDTVRAISPCVNPGVYWLWVGPSVFAGIPCGKQYFARVTCDPCPSGRCCYGSDPANPSCSTVNEADCSALAGTWTVGLSCASNPCPQHLGCQVGAIMDPQPPHNGDENWTGVTSESNLGYTAYDDFAGLTQPVGSIRFWGLNVYYSGSWGACAEDPMPFVIRFYPDSSNFPASAPSCTYNVSLSRTATSVMYGSFPLWEYTADLTPPCSQVDGWVSVQGQGDTTCWFL